MMVGSCWKSKTRARIPVLMKSPRLPQQFAILIIDDEIDLSSSMSRILNHEGYQTQCASSIQEALNRNDLDRYFLIFLDRKLPDGMSEDFLPVIREKAPRAAIIVITGYADLESSIAVLRHGAEDYMIKPVNPVDLIAHARRIAQLRLKEDALAEAQKKLVQSERLAGIGEAIAGLSHESRNALQRCQVCVDLLLERLHADTESLDLVEKIQKSLKELRYLYEEVRQYAAPIVLHPICKSIQDIVQNTWNQVTEDAGDRVTQFREEVQSGNLRCEFDPFQLGQVFRNLFENSLAACTDPACILVRYRDTRLADEDSLQIIIRDNGPGMSEEQQRRVFDSFYTTKSKGTGLGLAIARRIVEAHHGEISVNPEFTAGAEFQITLPRKQPACSAGSLD